MTRLLLAAACLAAFLAAVLAATALVDQARLAAVEDLG